MSPKPIHLSVQFEVSYNMTDLASFMEHSDDVDDATNLERMSFQNHKKD